MLIKRNDFMTSSIRPVKKAVVVLMSTLVVCTSAIAPAAFAWESPLVEKTVTVKFRLSDLDAENGVQKTYRKITKKAKSYCRADRSTSQYFGQSMKECTDDLVNQFIENTEVDSLKAFHLAKTSKAKTKVMALNKS